MAFYFEDPYFLTVNGGIPLNEGSTNYFVSIICSPRNFFAIGLAFYSEKILLPLHEDYDINFFNNITEPVMNNIFASGLFVRGQVPILFGGLLCTPYAELSYCFPFKQSVKESSIMGIFGMTLGLDFSYEITEYSCPIAGIRYKNSSFPGFKTTGEYLNKNNLELSFGLRFIQK